MRAGICVVLCAAAGWAQGLESAHSAAREALVEELEQLAGWCVKQRLFLDRNRTYAVILQFERDHVNARKWLHYRKTRNGWVKQKGFRKPTNKEPEHHLAWQRKLQEIGTRFGDRLAPALEATKVWSSLRARVVRDVFRVAWNHEEVRRLNDQVRYRGAWRMRDTIKSIQRRKEIARMARKAIFNVGNPRRGRVKPWERKMGLRFTEVWETPTWRLVTTCAPGEAETAAKLAGACAEFFDSVFETTVPPRPGQLVFLVTTRE